MKKNTKIILGVVGVIILIFGVLTYINLFVQKYDKAVLNFDEGRVEVLQANTWMDAENGMKLKSDASIKTFENPATVTLMESIIVELEPNTEISIQELSNENVKIRQESGNTWNKFTSVLGITNYEVETPTTVATVRGTEFGVGADDSSVIVLEGEVGFSSEGKEMMLKGFESGQMKNGQMIKQALTLEQKRFILSKAKKTLERLKGLREKMIDRRRGAIENAMEKYGKSEGELRAYLDKIDSGEVDDKELLGKSPIKLPEFERLIKLNSEIKDQMRLIAQLEESIQKPLDKDE